MGSITILQIHTTLHKNYTCIPFLIALKREWYRYAQNRVDSEINGFLLADLTYFESNTFMTENSLIPL